MRKIVLLAAALLCSISFSEVGIVVSLMDFHTDKETGKRIFHRDTNYVMCDGEVIAKIETRDDAKISAHFASSSRNGQVTLAVNRYSGGEPYTMMYTIDVKSKAIVKEERLNAINAYKDSSLEFSIIGDLKDTAVMQYVWKGKRHEAAFPTRALNRYSPIKIIYDSFGNAYLVFNDGDLIFKDDETFDLTLYVFSMDKKKLTRLGNVNISVFTRWIAGFYFPLDEYAIYYPGQKLTNQIFLYRYAEDAFYATRYQKPDRKTVDTIYSNIRNGNTYEQFLPLTKVENKDSLVRYFLCSKHTIYHDCRLDGGAF